MAIQQPKQSSTMKTNTRKLIGAVLFGFAVVSADLALAQTVQTTSSTTSVGTVSEFGPQTLVIRSETAPAPIRYTYSKTTTYVDEAGNPVSIETVKSGLPVTVYYSQVGDEMVASKVIVRKTVQAAPVPAPVPAPAPAVVEKKTTTTTTTAKKSKKDDDDDKD